MAKGSEKLFRVALGVGIGSYYSSVILSRFWVFQEVSFRCMNRNPLQFSGWVSDSLCLVFTHGHSSTYLIKICWIEVTRVKCDLDVILYSYKVCSHLSYFSNYILLF